MRYTYAYKTPDGVRHEDSMDASSREEVFVELRKRGIKAIKVVASDGSKANGETKFVIRKRFVLIALAAGLAGGMVLTQFFPSDSEDGTIPSKPKKPRIEFTDKLLSLQNETRKLLAEHDRRMANSGIGILNDYAAIFTNDSTAVFGRAIKAGYHELNVSRQRMRDVFRPFYNLSPSDKMQERNSAQSIYDEAMEQLDHSESQLVRNEKAYRLLVSNKGKWIVRDGKVIFADDSLAMEFEYFIKENGK